MMTIYDKEAMLGKLKDEFAAIPAYVETAVGRAQICDVEREVFRTLQQLGRSLLEYFIAQSGTGYQAEAPPRAHDGTALTFKGLVESPYFSIFGEVTITRAAYASPSQTYVYPVDAQLNLPEHKYSYLLTQWVLARATETDFREAVELLNEMFEFTLFPVMPQRLCAAVAPAVEPFYAQSPPPTPESEGSHLAISADGKGVRILKAERQGADTSSEPPKARRGKGEKPGITKQAVVTVDFSFTPEPREPEAIVQALLHEFTPEERHQAKSERRQRRDAGEPAPRAACNKHVCATLSGKEVAMEALMARIAKRDPAGAKRLVVLLDGELALATAVTKALENAQLAERVDAVILDIIHVSEYVWDVGTALYGEKDPQRGAWVREKLLALLRSEVGRVVGGLKQTLTKTDLRPTQHAALQKTITYFENHRHMTHVSLISIVTH